jgi:hypothetical protein
MAKDKLPSGIGPRTAVFLRERYPRDRAKLIAGQFRVSMSTAQRWLDGTAPTTSQLEAMFALWGADFLRTVFAEAFVLQDRSATLHALVQARIKLLQQLGNPADPLAKARQMHELGFRWGGLDWVPRRGSDVEFCAVANSGRSGPPPKTPLHEERVSNLLKALSDTVPRETFMQKLRWKLGW